LILPPYQKQGHGRALLDLVYEESLKNTEVFEITVEGPSFEFQCLRDFKEAEMLLRESLLRFPSI
jgi:histone acetyltransferase 1